MKIKNFTGSLILAAIAVVGLSLTLSSTAGTCSGTWYDYYATPAKIEIVGSKVVCPGQPDQIDTAADGSYTETPWFDTYSVSCPCNGGGGGGGGNGEDGEDPGFP